MLKTTHAQRNRILNEGKTPITISDLRNHLDHIGTAACREMSVIPKLTDEMLRIGAEINRNKEAIDEYRDGLKNLVMGLGLHAEAAKHMHALPLMQFYMAAHRYLVAISSPSPSSPMETP